MRTAPAPGQKEEQFHRPLPPGLYPDAPDLGENPLNLYTLAYIHLVETLADVLFPPRSALLNGEQVVIRASAAKVDRYVLFRAAWQPEFGKNFQLALRDLSAATISKDGTHFANLPPARQEAILEAMEAGGLQDHWDAPPGREPAKCFTLIYDTITEGLLGEPGYGGNDAGLGWQYSGFMPIGGKK